jgi:hypothetical protein
MEKKKMAKALMLTAALAGGMALANSFTNEVQATAYCCVGSGRVCLDKLCNDVDKQRFK